MALPQRRTGRIDRDLATQPFWQLGSQQPARKVKRRDLFGAIATAEGAPLGEPELDALSWVIDEWHEQGSPSDGLVRFTWFALGGDLYGKKTAGWSPSGRHRALMRQAIDNLMAVVVTLHSVNVHDGDRQATLRSKVHLIESTAENAEVQRYRTEIEHAQIDREQGKGLSRERRERLDAHGSPLGRLRAGSMEVTLAPWLVQQLLTGAVVFDWRTQRTLSGAAKRLWYQLTAMESEFEPTAFPGERVLMIDLTADFYAAMNLQAARERDNRAALVAAAQRVVAADPVYSVIDVLRRADSSWQLRVIRSVVESQEQLLLDPQ